jgi:hypothetical protein
MVGKEPLRHPADGTGGHHEGASDGYVDLVASPPESGGRLFENYIVPEYEPILKG